MSEIVPCLWFPDKAEEACRFYVSLLPNSRIDSVRALPADSGGGPTDSVQIIEFTLAGEPYMAMGAGPLDPFNHAVSFMVKCANQDEIDRLWEALSDGGAVEQCGWLKDRYGVSWQVVPYLLGEMLKAPDRARAKRVMDAVLGMVKLDLAKLRQAYDGIVA
jgi:predicted 3-demethylubiquinone-9 3-methyltransferase (glyoxalase superfamily)